MSWNYFLMLFFILSANGSHAQNHQDTLKGSLTQERIWWDVLHYDLTVKPDYRTQTITGKNIVEYRVNKAKITRIEGNRVFINQHEIPVEKNYKVDFFDRLRI